MGQRVSGKDFDTSVGELQMHVSKCTLSITDNSKVAKDKGVPNGWVSGDVEASGELTLDAAALAVLTTAASSAGSFRELDPLDILFYAKTVDDEELKVEAFGCKLRIESLLDIDSAGGSKHESKIPFIVTSPDFVRINGVSYLSSDETSGLVSD